MKERNAAEVAGGGAVGDAEGYERDEDRGMISGSSVIPWILSLRVVKVRGLDWPNR